ncbi:unnamed protein product [Xylocopa violacea]|uniref:Uncharacterized protein n=1 Tax=Xylocopa violacea TaxID=135666 RepID=A0ABP1N4A9_XYLVO
MQPRARGSLGGKTDTIRERSFLAETGRKDAKTEEREERAISPYLIEGRPGSFRVDLEVLGLYVADTLPARLLAGHSVGSFATRSLRRSKTAKRDEAREEAGPRPCAILLSLSPRKRRLRHGAVPCVTRILAKGSSRRTGDGKRATTTLELYLHLRSLSYTLHHLSRIQPPPIALSAAATSAKYETTC